MPAIPAEEIVFHHRHCSDLNGRLFLWGGELYRGIFSERAAFCRDLFANGVVEELVTKGLLVETILTDWQLEGFGAVLRHATIPFVSYPHEWCGAMLREAALLTLDLEIELSKHNLTLQDGHGWNVLFRGPTPSYVDFGSIQPAQPGVFWGAHDEFCRSFLYPLLLIEHGYGGIARALLHLGPGVTHSELLALIHDAPLIKRDIVHGSELASLERLREKVAGIELLLPRTDWTEYYGDRLPPLTPSDVWTPKHWSVYQVLSGLKPTTVIDLGSNRGWYSQLAASLGHRVVALEVDESCVASLFDDVKESCRSALPLFMDIARPSPASNGVFCEPGPSAAERLRSSVGMALALVHHLVFKNNMRFEQIVDGLSLFSADRALVEFVPREDRFVREWWSPRFSWYTMDGFISSLKQEFRNVTILPSHPEPRVLLLCER